MEDENQNVMPVPDYPSFPLSSYMCLKVLSCNAHLACPFSEAYIDMVPMQNDREDVYFFPLQTLIPKAYSFLSLEANNFTGIRIADPENATEEQKAAFHCLQNFLQNQEDHVQSLQAMRMEGQDATKACYTLAVHLFSQLVPGEQVTINSRMKGIDELPSCPCKCGRNIDIGNTGIGHPKVWHGNPDIVIKTGETTIVVKKNVKDTRGDGPESKKSKLSDEDEEDEDYSFYSVEEGTDIFEYKFQNQLISQTLTNSFVQKNQHGFIKRLVPAIGCTYDNIIVALYDPDRDILLRRVAPISVLEEDSDSFNLLGILEIWRILNLHIVGADLCNLIVPELDQSGFRSQIEARKVLKYYSSAKTDISIGQSQNILPPLLTVMNNVKQGKFIVKGISNK